MKIKTKVTVTKEIDVKTLNVRAGVRYWEDAEINGVRDEEGTLTPCRKGDNWMPNIDLETGVINNWKKGTVAKLHFKVCDDGAYRLKDAEGNTVKTKRGYVPNILCPKENGFGDYIIMDIDANGQIANWKCDLSDWNNEN